MSPGYVLLSRFDLISAFPSKAALSEYETPREPKNSGAAIVSFKDQVREAINDPNAVPVAAAVPVTESRIANEEKAALERENIQHQKRILVLQRQQMEVERERQAEREQQNNQNNNGFSKKQWTYIGVIGALLLLAAAIVGVCASGNCGSGDSTSPEQAPSPPTVQTTTEPVAAPSTSDPTAVTPPRAQVEPLPIQMLNHSRKKRL